MNTSISLRFPSPLRALLFRAVLGIHALGAAALILAAPAHASADAPSPGFFAESVPTPSAFSGDPQSFSPCDPIECPDTYVILVSNVGAAAATSAAVDRTETCAPGAWTANPAFTYQWLRNGSPISGATASTYIPKAADQGKMIQCEVRAQGAGSTVLAVSAALLVPPSPSTSPLPEPASLSILGTILPGTAGSSLSCAGAIQWLRNGSPISGATSPTYEAVAEDQGKDLQCEGLIKAAGAQVLTLSPALGAETTSTPPVLTSGRPPLSPGPLTVTDTLPAGLYTQRTPHSESVEYWSCTPEGAGKSTVTCTDYSDQLPAEGGLATVLRIPVAVDPSIPPGTILTNTVEVSGAGATPVSISQPTLVNPPSPRPFELADLGALLAGPSGTASGQAGAHPASLTTGFDATSITFPNSSPPQPSKPVEDFKELTVDLPPGLLGDPRAAPLCPLSALVLNAAGVDGQGDSACPADTRVGTLTFSEGGGYGNTHNGYKTAATTRQVFNLVPERGYAAEFGFTFAGFPFVVYARAVGTGASTHVQVTVPGIPASAIVSFQGALATFFGDPATVDESGSPDVPFFRDPTHCTGQPLQTAIHIDSYEDPAAHNPDGSPDLSDPAWKGAEVTMEPLAGCAGLGFGPSVEARPTTDQGDAPSGLHVDLHLPQVGLEEPGASSEADLKKAVVTLPEGMVANASLADGLAACAEAQIGLQANEPGSCPDASKLGTVEVETPLLEHPLPGSVYLATPHQNPFGSLLALYIEVADPVTGTYIKLPGVVHPDPTTGRLTATFDQNPQVPFTDFRLDFFAGARASLTTPATCGQKTTETDLEPWSENGDAHPTDTFQITQGCAAGEAAEPNHPAFSAGTESPQAGAYSPFVLKLSREDGSQPIHGLDVTLPPGLTGKLAGVGECSEAQIAGARSREREGGGAEELADPSCPTSTEIGTVHVGAGSGNPFYVTGHAYLAGPYKGAPLSMVIVTPAVAGPFDLGTVVVRAALYVNPETAQITVKSDPIPTILDGIPLDVRSIAVDISRNQFTINPTSCDPMSLTATAIATSSEAALSSPFQVGGCGALGFAPKLALSLKGTTHRAGHPALKALLTYPKGAYANIAKAQVNLPHSEFLDQGHLNDICTKVVFAEGQKLGEKCPPSSVYGFAKAETPLLQAPLEGPVYLRSPLPGHKLPDLVAALNGQISVALVGKIDTGPNHGIRNTFEVVPDAPVSRFELTMQGGGKGLLENSEDICSKPQRAIVDFTAQNGKVDDFNPLIANSCKGGKGKKRHKASKRQANRAVLSRLLGAW